MARLIDADKLNVYKAWVEIKTDDGAVIYAGKRKIVLADDVADAPAVDPVKHGHWTIEDVITYERSYGGTLYEPVYKCSCCGRVTESYIRGDEPIMPEDADFPKFCGNCGAYMGEKTK